MKTLNCCVANSISNNTLLSKVFQPPSNVCNELIMVKYLIHHQCTPHPPPLRASQRGCGDKPSCFPVHGFLYRDDSFRFYVHCSIEAIFEVKPCHNVGGGVIQQCICFLVNYSFLSLFTSHTPAVDFPPPLVKHHSI